MILDVDDSALDFLEVAEGLCSRRVVFSDGVADDQFGGVAEKLSKVIRRQLLLQIPRVKNIDFLMSGDLDEGQQVHWSVELSSGNNRFSIDSDFFRIQEIFQDCLQIGGFRIHPNDILLTDSELGKAEVSPRVGRSKDVSV